MKTLRNIFAVFAGVVIVVFFLAWHYNYYDIAAFAFVAGLVILPIAFFLQLYVETDGFDDSGWNGFGCFPG